MRRAVLWLVLILPGLAVVSVSLFFAQQDWAVLQSEMAVFDAVAHSDASTHQLLAAEAYQNLHRINLFAEGVWCLLGWLGMGLGIVGLMLLGRGRPAGPS